MQPSGIVACHKGFLAMLWSCASFRNSHPDNLVILGLDFESDGTTQCLSQELLQRVGRPTRRKLATEVMAQSGRICIQVIQHGEVQYTHWEDLISSPFATMGKTAPFVVAAFDRGFGINFASPAWRSAFRAAANRLVLNFRSDLGSNNAPAQRHFAATVQENYVHTLYDTTACEVHVCNRIRTARVRSWFSLGFPGHS